MLHLTTKRKGGDLGLNFIKRCTTATSKIRTIFGIPHNRSQAAATLERITIDARYGELPMVTEVRPLQPRNAEFPMLVTE